MTGTATSFGGNNNNNSIVQASDTFFSVGAGENRGAGTPTEARAQTKFEIAGVLSLHTVNVIANNASQTTITWATRIGGVAGNESVGTSGNVTGQFSDSTHSDSISATNLVSFSVHVGSSNHAFTFSSANYKFVAGTGAGEQWTSHCNGTTVAASTTDFFPIAGCDANTGYYLAANTDIKAEIRAAMAATNLYAFVQSNTSTNPVTVTLEKSGSDGNNTISLTNGTTGAFEDTTHSDSFTTTDTMYGKYATGAGTSNTAVSIFGITVANTGTRYDHISQHTYSSSASQMSTTLDNYWHFHGSMKVGPTNTETDAQQQYPFVATASNMRLWRDFSNASGGTLTATYRKGAADGSETFSMAQGVTGLFEDTTHTDSVAANDLINLKVTHPTLGVHVVNRVMISMDSATSVAYADSVLESASLTDAVSAQAAFVAAIAESAPLTDTDVANEDGTATVLETALLTDLVSASASILASVSESAPLTDVYSATQQAEDSHNVITIYMNQVG